MDILNNIIGLLGDNEKQAIAEKSGLNTNDLSNVLQGAIPAILGALNKNTNSTDGANSLAGALDRDHDGSILDNLGGFLSNPEQGNGAGILKHLFGQNQSNVEQGLSKSTGIDMGSITKLLPVIAPVILGYLGKEKKSQGLDAGGLSSLLNIASNSANSSSGIDLSDIMNIINSKNKTSSILGLVGKGLLGRFFKR